MRRAIFWNVEYIFILQYFQKKKTKKNSIFQETSEKLFWWHICPFFSERKRLVQKLI